MIRVAVQKNVPFKLVNSCYSILISTLCFVSLSGFNSPTSAATSTQLPNIKYSASRSSKLVDQDLKAHLKLAISNAESFKDKFDAQVWLMDMSNRLKRFIKKPEKRIAFLKVLHQEATKAKLPPEAVLAVIQIESAFKQYAISYVGARGYMQVMPFWKKEIGRDGDNMMDLETNLRYGCTILAYYLKIEKGNWIRALGRYNGSLGKMKYPEKVLLAWERNWYVENI